MMPTTKHRKTPTAAKVPAARLERSAREKTIVDAAISLFSEEGLSGQTRELAAKVGITQSALYKHFPNKEAIIDRVYETVFAERWKPEWEAWLTDRSTPLPDRLIAFYTDYAQILLARDTVRLLLFFGLNGRGEFSQRYLKFMHERAWWRIVVEVRHFYGRPSPAEEPIKVVEIELVWSLIASILHIGIRRHVFGLHVPNDIEPLIAYRVRAFFEGAPKVMESTESDEVIYEALPDMFG